MTNEYFKGIYTNYLEHRWVTSSDKAKAEEQKRREKEYNHQYYIENQRRIAEQRRAYNESHRSGARQGRLMTSEDALHDLNRQQREMAGPQGPSTKPVDYERMSDTERKVYEGEVQALMDKAPLMSRTKAESLITDKRARNQKEAKDVAERNARMEATYKNQGQNIRNAEMQRRQQSTLNRISNAAVNASNAQTSASKSNRQARALNKRSYADTQASRAQASAALNRRNNALTNKQNNTLFRRTVNDVKTSINYVASRMPTYLKNNTQVANINKGIERAVSKVSRTINNGRASVAKVTDMYNKKKEDLQTIYDFTKKTLSKYFG